jgi:pyruvate dehydrogenase E1 component beta subunit
VRRAGRLIVVHEASGLCGIAAEIAVLAATKAFDALRTPVVRLNGPDAPAASSWVLEQAGVPQVEAWVAAAAELVLGTPEDTRAATGRPRAPDPGSAGIALR